MKLNDKGYNLIKEFEGLKLKPYLCSAQVPTIGYGSTYYENGTKVKLTDAPITKERADALFKIVADDFAKRVVPLIKKPVTQNQFNALVSFAFNLGVRALQNSTLLRLVNINPNDANIAASGPPTAAMAPRANEPMELNFCLMYPPMVDPSDELGAVPGRLAR